MLIEDIKKITIITIFKNNNVNNYFIQLNYLENYYKKRFTFNYIFYSNKNIENDFIKNHNCIFINEKFPNKSIINKRDLKSQWTIILDNDLYFNSNIIDRMINIYRENNNIAMLLPNSMDYNKKCKNKIPHKCKTNHYYDTSSFVDNKYNFYLSDEIPRCNPCIENIEDINNWENNKIIEVKSAYGGFAFIRSDILESEDVFWSELDFNEDLNNFFSENLYFCKRVRKYGKIFICPDIICYYDNKKILNGYPFPLIDINEDINIRVKESDYNSNLEIKNIMDIDFNLEILNKSINLISNNNNSIFNIYNFIKTNILFKSNLDKNIKTYLLCGNINKYNKILNNPDENIKLNLIMSFETNIFLNEYKNYLNKIENIFVPCKFIKSLLLKNGIKAKIHIIHFGYVRYKKIDVNHNSNEFKIGFLGDPLKRKNIDKIIYVCSNLKKIINIKLFIHIPKFKYEKNKIQLLNILNEIENKEIISFSHDIKDYNEISKWYSNLNCLICLSSIDGWSYTPRESLYLGIPTIITNIDTHKELCESGFYEVIDISKNKDISIHIESINKEYVVKNINTEQIKNSILNVYNNYKSFLIKSNSGKEWIKNMWINNDIGNFIIKKIFN